MSRSSLALWIAAVAGCMAVVAAVSMAIFVDSAAKNWCSGELIANHTAIINHGAFCPGTAQVVVGTTITWRNDDRDAHTVTARGIGTLNSGTIAPGASWSYPFPRRGTYRYVCSIHPAMAGVVEVSELKRAP